MARSNRVNGRLMRLVSLVLMCLAVCPAVAGRTVRDFFASEPGKVFPLLDESSRLDMMDYFEAGKRVYPRTAMGTTSHIDTLTTSYIKLHTSDVREVALRMFTTKRDTVIAVLETIAIPALDSRLTLYDRNWKPLPDKRQVKTPRIAQFIRPGTPQRIIDELNDAVAFDVVEMRFEGDNFDTLVARHSLRQFLTPQVWKTFAPHLLDSIVVKLKF